MRAAINRFLLRLAVLPGFAHRRRLNELIEAHEKAVQEREDLLAVVCHDLQNPLSVIQLATESLISKVGTPRLSEEDIQIKLRQIHRCSERIDLLIRDVLDRQKIDSGTFLIEPSEVDVSAFWSELNEFFVPLARRKHIVIVFAEPPENLTLSFDPRRIFQVVSNLVGNAIKFSQDGGRIEVWIEREGQSIKFFVKDFGPGIPAADHERIFSKFFQCSTNKKQGSGLGLYIAQEIVRVHGGEIGVVSEQGKQTTFWFSLPEKTTAIENRFHLAVTDGCVMIVDDDDDLRSVMRSALEDQNYQVIDADSVSHALQALSASARLPDVVVVDYDLPGATGADLIQALQSSNTNPPQFILISAHPEVFLRARNLGVAHVVRKPMKLGRFISVVNRAISETGKPSVADALAHGLHNNPT